MRHYTRYILGAMAGLLLWPSPQILAKDMTLFPITPVQKQLVRQTGWLNTSRSLTADDVRGRILLLDFWTYCCINCMQIMPDLHYLEERFDDKLTVIGVHSAKFKNERDSENIRQAILRNDLTHPVVNDFDFSTWQAFDVHAWPTLILIGPEGNIVQTYTGEGHRDEIARDVEALIATYGDRLNRSPLPIALEKTKAPPHRLNFPAKLAYAPDYPGGGAFFVSDSGNHRILVLARDGRIIEQIGSGEPGRKDGAFDTARFMTPQGLAYHNQVLYVADTGNHLVRAVHLDTRQVSSIAGTGARGAAGGKQAVSALHTALASPWDVAFYPDNAHLTIAAAGTHQIWEYDMAGKHMHVLAGSGREAIRDGAFPDNALAQPSGLSAYGDRLYFVDAETSSLRVLKGGTVTTLIGSGLFDFGFKDGRKDAALMQHPLGLAADEGVVYIADSYNHSIRMYDSNTGMLSTLAGHGERGHKDGPFNEATFNEPNDVLLAGHILYVADTNNHAIRKLDLKAKTVSTLAVRESPAVDIFSDALPNMERLPEQHVTTSVPVTVRLDLQKGWKINKEAPSRLSLFVREDGKHKVLAQYDRDDMASRRLVLPKLAAGTYRLQGTLYYCEEKEGAQCLLKSFDVPLAADKTGGMDVTLPVR